MSAGGAAAALPAGSAGQLLAANIIGELAQVRQLDTLGNRRHGRVGPRAAVEVVQFLVEVIALLAPDDRRHRVDRRAVLAVAGAADFRFAGDIVGGLRRRNGPAANQCRAENGRNQIFERIHAFPPFAERLIAPLRCPALGAPRRHSTCLRRVWRGVDWRGRHARQAGGGINLTAPADARPALRRTPRTRCD